MGILNLCTHSIQYIDGGYRGNRNGSFNNNRRSNTEFHKRPFQNNGNRRFQNNGNRGFQNNGNRGFQNNGHRGFQNNGNRGFQRGGDRFEKKTKAEIEREEEILNKEELPKEEEIDAETYKDFDPNAKATVFIGQLPFDCTKDDLMKYLKDNDVDIKNIRLLTDKSTGKFKGMAFVDVLAGNVCKMLKLHHTFFKGRCINIEETMDGGKKSQERQKFLKKRREIHDQRIEESYKEFMERLFERSKTIQLKDIDTKCLDALESFPKAKTKKIIQDLIRADPHKIKNLNAYIMGIVKRTREGKD
ncbi:hypothetical protein WA158_006216 [Blastocystis sp. Blastoise]